MRPAGWSATAISRLRPSARPHGVARPVVTRRLAAVPPGLGRARPARTNVAGCVRPAGDHQRIGVAKTHGSDPPPNWRAPGAGLRPLGQLVPAASASRRRTGRRRGPHRPFPLGRSDGAISGRCAGRGRGPRRWWDHSGRPDSAARRRDERALEGGEACVILHAGTRVGILPRSIRLSHSRTNFMSALADKLHVGISGQTLCRVTSSTPRCEATLDVIHSWHGATLNPVESIPEGSDRG
jgi:hypothetical protein